MHPTNPIVAPLRDFLVPNKVIDVSCAGHGHPVVFTLNNGGRLAISGNFNFHLEQTIGDPNVVDVVAREPKE